MIESMSQWIAEHFVLGLLVFARLAALLIAMPTLCGAIPHKIRVLMALVITAMLVPTIAANNAGTPESSIFESTHLLTLVIALGREVVIGMLIGTTIQLIITGIQLGAEVTSSSGAFQATTSDASGESMPSLAKFVGLMVVAIMFAAGGHRMVINSLLDSFTNMPPGSVVIHESMLWLVVDQLTAGTSAGIRVAAPVIAALLLSNLIIGLISRTLPQLNVLAVGLSVNALALLVVTAITIGSAGLIFQDELVSAVNRLGEHW